MLTPTVKMPCWVHCRGVTVCRLLSVGFLSWLPALSLPLVLLAGGDVTPSLSSILLSILIFCPFSDIVGKEPLFDVSWSSTHLSCLDCCPWMTSRVAPYVASDCNSAVALLTELCLLGSEPLPLLPCLGHPFLRPNCKLARCLRSLLLQTQYPLSLWLICQVLRMGCIWLCHGLLWGRKICKVD